MTIEEYHTQCLNLGIKRGALADGFSFELPSVVAANKQPVYLTDKVGKVEKPPLSDLSHMNPSNHASGQRGGRHKKNTGNGGAARGRVPKL